MILIAVYQADTLLSVRSCLYMLFLLLWPPLRLPLLPLTTTTATIASTAMSTALRYGILETV
eukprot:7314-Heterococcus_DN1.PRE.10